jgi:hypothetical protein
MVISKVSLSTDIFRYMWDGMLLGSGVDPYRYVPSSGELDGFKNVNYFETYDHKDEFTIYPPFAQLFFALNYVLFGNSQLGLKSLLSIFDLFNGFLIFQIILRLRDDKSKAYYGALIYLWNPLVVIEFSNSGHLDAMAIFLVLLSLYSLLNSAVIKSYVFLALGILTKWIPLLIIPFYLKFILNKKPSYFSKISLSTILISVILVLPFYLSSGFNFITSMIYFIQTWRFESSLFRLLAALLNLNSPGEFIVLKVVSYIVFLTSFPILLYRMRSSQVKDIIDYSILIVALFYLITPRVYPWYVIWVIVFISLTTRAWICIPITGIVGFNYLKLFPNFAMEFFPDFMENVLWAILILVVVIYYFSRSNIGDSINSRILLRFRLLFKGEIVDITRIHLRSQARALLFFFTISIKTNFLIYIISQDIVENK